MKNAIINTGGEEMKDSVKRLVREKAINAGNTIIYGDGENIIEEDPRTSEKKILKKISRKVRR